MTRDDTPLRRCASVCFILLLVVFCDALGQDSDWRRAKQEIVRRMLKPDSDYVSLIEEVEKARPKTTQAAMFKVCVLVDAGMNVEAIEALRELRVVSPETGECSGLNSLFARDLIDYGAFDVAKVAVELFARQTFSRSCDTRFLASLMESGWTIEQVNQWVDSLVPDEPDFWIKPRLDFNVRHGRAEEAVAEITRRVQSDPSNIQGVIRYLDALVYTRSPMGMLDLDLSWMPEMVQPKLATEAMEIAAKLASRQLSDFKVAEPFYRQAVKTPLTSQEVDKLSWRCPQVLSAEQVLAGPSTEQVLAQFACQMREALAKCLLESDQADEAQLWMVEAADMRKKYDLKFNADFAGRTQRASGQRIIENRIKADEANSRHDPQYWLDRVAYYRGRKEIALEEEAYKEGLRLTADESSVDRLANGKDYRATFVLDYAQHFLRREGRNREAVTFLRHELQRIPASSDLSRGIVGDLKSVFKDYVRVDDELLWNWLSKREEWEDTEGQLLDRMLEKADRSTLNTYVTRSEAMCFGKHPSRAYRLGYIVQDIDMPRRSVRLLKYAIEKSTKHRFRDRASFVLFQTYLDMNDWREAEALFPVAVKRSQPNVSTIKYVTDWYAQVALAAARAGAREDAMRIWRRVWNVCPMQIEGLKELSDAGLGGVLMTFYAEIHKRLPTSQGPARAMSVLKNEANVRGTASVDRSATSGGR